MPPPASAAPVASRVARLSIRSGDVRRHGQGTDDDAVTWHEWKPRVQYLGFSRWTPPRSKSAAVRCGDVSYAVVPVRSGATFRDDLCVGCQDPVSGLPR